MAKPEKTLYKTEYKLIQAESVGAFERACDAIAEKGYIPYFQVSVVMIPFKGENLTKYVQQWSKTTTIQ